jgi:glycosyltransferase involved in cell wall biosynthesis
MFTVIIPTYNRPMMTIEAIKSVLAQTEPASLVIVVDDGSTDDTYEQIQRRFCDAVILLRQENKGVSAARNAGIALAKTRWCAFLDSDDLWEPKKLALQKAYIDEHPEVRILQTEEIWIRNGKRVNPCAYHAKGSGDIFEASLKRCLVSPSAVAVHRAVFEKIGLFDPHFPACEDYDLWLRANLYYPIITLPEAGIKKRGGGHDQLSAQWGLDQWRIRALHKVLAYHELTDERKKLVIEEIVRRAEIVLQGAEKRGRRDDVREYERYLDPPETWIEDLWFPHLFGGLSG